MRPNYLCPFLFALLGAAAAFPSDMGRIHGELSCDSCNSYSNVVIDVVDVNRRPVGTYSVSSMGDFEMNGIPDGNYVMTIRGANGSEIATQTVSVTGDSAPVNIRLPEGAVAGQKRTAKEAAISVYRLSHRVPKAAKKEFDRASRAAENNENDKVIAHLQKAVEIDPEYVEALNNLGSRYIQVDQIDKAMEVLERAQKLDPASYRVHTNLAVALLSLQKPADAERAARRAYQLASNDPRARYILALSLYSQQEFTEETVKLLQASRDTFPNANIALGYVYFQTGKTKEARGVLTSYLAAGHTAREKQVREMLAMMPKQ